MSEHEELEQPQKPNGNMPEICISPVEGWDKERIVIHDAVTSVFNIGNVEVSSTTCAGYYLNDDGEECKLYIAAPSQGCFGVSYTFPMEVKQEDQTPDKRKGMQVMYQLTSLKTVAEPLAEEQAYIDFITDLWEAGVQKGREEAEKDEPTIPASSVNSFVAASRKENWENAVKKPFAYPKTKDKKSLDMTKPLRQYIKLITHGEGETLSSVTPFYGPGDKPVNAAKFVDVRGNIEPCIAWEGVYFGSHGPTAPQGASLRFKLVEANYTPQSIGHGSLPSKRVLARNNAPIVEDDGEGEVKSYGPGNDDDFEKPGDKKALVSAPKKTPPKKSILKKGVADVAVPPKPKSKAVVAPKAKTVAAPVKAKAAPKAKVATKVAPKAKVATKAKVVKAAPKPVVEEPDENDPLLGDEEVEEDADVEEDDE